MRNSIYLSILAVLIGFYSCDKVKNPVVKQYDDGLNWDLFPNGDSANYDWPVWTQNTNTNRNVLLEDYTGHTCTNCPAAADIAKQLEDANPNRVFVASIHASNSGFFQAVAPNAPSEFTTDFTTTAGTEYCNVMDGFQGNPLGTTNRTNDGYQPGVVWQQSTEWVNKTNALLSTTLLANLQVDHNYYESTNGLFLHVETEILSELSGPYNLVNYLIRDTVIAPQKLLNGSTEEHYHHHGVLSDNINGTWGTQIIETSAAAGDKIYNDFTYEVPVLDSTYNIENLSVLTYLCNRETYEVLQVVKTKL